ncbi:MAG: hypothetical protein HQK81_09370 [Desulfovibrionaceae bacterium]|nr:hypothetical protein [Desulfovibrionaceae bacterium]MBF0514249.1 hypothetical protein [Desulfovibrionaceae bacterium]
MAPTHDWLQSMFQVARGSVVDVSPLEDGFAERVLARLDRNPQAVPGALRGIPAWSPAPVFAALCLLALAWTLLAPQANLDLMGGMLGLFDMESLGQVLPENLLRPGMLS